MSESKFKDLQEDVCLKPPEEEQESDKICPTCLPNPSFIPPDWTQMEDPYLNEKTCQYQIRAMINIDADIYYDSDQDLLSSSESEIDVGSSLAGKDRKERTVKKLSSSPYEFSPNNLSSTLLKSYIRPAIRRMLRFYGKLETDDVVCAAPPTGPNGTCQHIFGLNYEKHVILLDVVTEGPIPEYYQRDEIDVDGVVQEFGRQITNPQALELFARPTDYSFITTSNILIVQISVPAFKFDMIPNAPDLGEVNINADKVIIKPPDFMNHIDVFKSALDSFKTFQSYFYREENGSIYFKETNEPFYIKFYAETRVAKFVDSLQNLMKKNGFDLKGLLDTGKKTRDIAEEIEITFNKEDEKNPFIVQNVRAKKKNCPYIECKKGLPAFIRFSENDQTLMGYMSEINNIGTQLKSNKTPPWIDFMVSKTFPQLAVNYGNSADLEDNACLSVNLQEGFDFLLEESMDFFKAVEYRFNQNTCKTPAQLEKERSEIMDYFNEDSPKAKKLNEDLTKAWEKRQADLDKIEEELGKVGDGAVEIYNDPIKGLQSLGKAIGDGTVAAGDAIAKFVLNFNPCDFAHSMAVAMKCLAAGLSLDELYYTMLKELISTGGAQAIELIMATLPANKQQIIQEKIEEQFKDMPFPWEPGWEAGSLGKAVDKQARKEIEQDIDQRFDYLTQKIDQARKEANTLSAEVQFLETTIENLNNDRYKQQLIAEINQKIQINQTEERQNKYYYDSLPAEIANNEDIIRTFQARLDSNLQRISELDSTNQQEIIALKSQNESYRQRIDSAKRANEINEENKIKYYRNYTRAHNLVLSLQRSLNSLDSDIEQAKQNLREEYEQKINKQYKQETAFEETFEYKNFDNLSPEDQQKFIDKQKEKVVVVSTTPKDRIVQGTMGKALGNVQEALTQAYLDEIMKTATIKELQKAYEAIPGANLLGKLISRFKCGNDPLIYPPIESFLSTLTFDPCGTEKTRISLPEIQEIPTNFNWVEQLTDAFWVSIREIGSRVMMALIMKATEVLGSELCRLAGNLTRAAIDGGLEGVIDELICPDLNTNVPDKSVADRQKRLSDLQKQKQKENLHNSLLTAGGAAGRSQESNNALVRLLSTSATQREIKEAMVGRGNPQFLSNISSLVRNVLPEFSNVFADSQSSAQFFAQMGNLMTVEQRSRAIADVNNPFEDFPVDYSICLTKEEKDLWDEQRASAFSDPNLGKAFVDRQNEKTKANLADVIKLSNGPDQLLREALDEAFAPKDPDCKNSIVPGFEDFPANRKNTVSNAITGIFKNLERAFLNDTIEDNLLSFSLIALDSSGILIEILCNTDGHNLAKHMFIKNNPFLSLFIGQDWEFPETVAIQLRNQIMFSLENNFKVGQDFNLSFWNQKSGDKEFTSKIAITDIDSKGKIDFIDYWSDTQFLTDNFLEIPDEYEPGPVVDFNNPFGAMTLGKMIEQQWGGFSALFEKKDFNSFYEGMNTEILTKLPKRFLERQEGQMSEGFLFGNENRPIVQETDLKYVGPDGEEYTYEEEEQVLGRSATNNPRVFFLDPSKHGGTYKAPNIYIADAKHKGWMNFLKLVVPNPTGCDPKNSNFLMLDTLIKEIEKNKSKIRDHKDISYSPTCVVELPFDKISNSETMATLEGIVRATIRVNITDFLIRTFPIFSNIHLDMDKNFDNIFLNYMVEQMYPSICDQTSIFASTYEGKVYGLLFLEQVTQIVSRKVRDGEMETNQEIEEILEFCNTIQEEHPLIYEKDMSYIRFAGTSPSQPTPEVQKMVDYVQAGTAIIANSYDLLNFLSDAGNVVGGVFFQWLGGGMSIEEARLAAKINSIKRAEPEIKKLLKYIVKEEFEKYAEKIREEFEPRPWIYDMKKFFIGGSGLTYGKQNQAGVFDVEVPIGGGIGSLPYGDVNDCAKREMNHPLNNTSISDERFLELEKRGGFYLEKYVVSFPKRDSNFSNVEENPFSAGGEGLLNIQEFKQFLNTNANLIGPDDNISDHFGNAIIDESGQSYSGTIGIKFGVRLCYMPPKGFDLGLSANERAKDQRSYILNPASFVTDSGSKTLESTKYSFPICSYEQDLTDVKLVDVLNSDSNLNQDIKCYIDKLVETKNFKHLVDNVLQLNKVSSIYMIYSYINLLPSLGADSERRQNDEGSFPSDDISKVLNNSKEECRKLFASFYKNDDRDPPNEEFDNTDVVQLAQNKLLNMISSINLGEFGWEIRRRIVKNNPHDKDGNECKNNFAKLFSFGGN